MTWHDDTVIVVVGEALVDLVIGLDGTVSAALGGAPFNTARTCGRLGATVAFMGAVSDDRFGSTIAAQLADDRVVDRPPAAGERPDDARRGRARRRRARRRTASTPRRPPPRRCARRRSRPPPQTLFAGGLGLVLEPMADTVVGVVTAVGDDVMVMIDLNCRPAVIDDRDRYVTRVDAVLGRADVVKVSDDDLAYLSPGEPPLVAARRLLTRGPGVVLLTAGGSNVTVLTADDERRRTRRAGRRWSTRSAPATRSPADSCRGGRRPAGSGPTSSTSTSSPRPPVPPTGSRASCARAAAPTRRGAASCHPTGPG